MKDEKRQTRLLPFRLRRAARAGALRHADADDTGMDTELRALLREWDAPHAALDARARLLEDFRAINVRRTLWRRVLEAKLQVPVPVAACALVALLAAFVFAAARTTTVSRVASLQPSALVQTSNAAASAAPEVKIVEVPVVQERVVTRFVYVEKKERVERTGVFEQDDARASNGARTLKRATASQDASQPTSFFTRVDMADFRPADEMKIRIVKRGKTDEK
jgi:hypothetical protein